MNETLTNIVSLNLPLPMIWLEIVRWAIARGRLDELLAQALATNPGNARLRQFIIEVSLSSDTAPDTRLEALVLPQIPFVNATEWRERMAIAERCVCRIEVDDGPSGWIG